VLTQCPSCHTVFRVTSAILRAAHGQVRCGRCNYQFDAIGQLLDQDDSEALPPADSSTEVGAVAVQANRSAPADDASQSMQPHDPGFTGIGHEDIILEGHRIEISGIYSKPINDQGESQLEQSQTIEEFNLDTEQWENPFNDTTQNGARQSDNPQELSNTGVNAMLSDGAEQDGPNDAGYLADNIEDSQEIADIADIEDELNAVDLAGELANLDANTSTLAEDYPDTPAWSRESDELADSFKAASAAGEVEDIVLSTGEFENLLDETPDPLATSELPAFLSASATARAPGRRWPWAIASVLAMLVLAAQVVHHFRTELARHPDVGPMLIKTYAALGLALTPHWLVDAYTIKQWGIVSDPQQPGILRMRASITNIAPFAQPYPLLRFTLEDRFGATVGQRDFRPEEYLTSRSQATRLLPGNMATNIDLSIVDPGPDAVGFQLDSCLSDTQANARANSRANSLAIRCAHDAAVH